MVLPLRICISMFQRIFIGINEKSDCLFFYVGDIVNLIDNRGGNKMKIEEYWEDKVIYHVTFFIETYKVSGKIELEKITKLLIMTPEITLQGITNLVLAKFKNVSEVISVEEVMDGLLLKETT